MPGDGNNDAIVAALVDPRKAMDNKPAEVVVEPVVEPAESKAAEAVDADNQSTGVSTDGAPKDKLDDPAYLKSQLGKQSNELGDLRKQVKELKGILESQPRTETTEATPSVQEQAVTAISEEYTPEFGGHLKKFVEAQLLPLQMRIAIQDLRAQNADFDELAPEMDKVLRERPHLAAVVSQDLNTLEDVLLLARARKGVKVLDSERNRVAAETEEKEREKKAAATEKPSKAASKAEPEATVEQMNQAWAAQIAGARHPNRVV
jgi:hypothetical protein